MSSPSDTQASGNVMEYSATHDSSSSSGANSRRKAKSSSDRYPSKNDIEDGEYGYDSDDDRGKYDKPHHPRSALTAPLLKSFAGSTASGNRRTRRRGLKSSGGRSRRSREPHGLWNQLLWRWSHASMAIRWTALVLVCLIFLVIVQTSRRRLMMKYLRDQLAKRHRAEQLWKQTRFADAPHAGTQQEIPVKLDLPKIEAAMKSKSLSPYLKLQQLERLFDQFRIDGIFGLSLHQKRRERLDILHTWLKQVNHDIVHNVKGGTKWTRPYLLPSLPGEGDDDARLREIAPKHAGDFEMTKGERREYQVVRRMHGTGTQIMEWEKEWEQMELNNQVRGPVVDYTQESLYQYSPVSQEVKDFIHDHPDKYLDPTLYPPLKPLRQLMENWNQDEDFSVLGPDGQKRYIVEGLYHLNYTNPEEMEIARYLRDHELPFKLYNVPEVTAATAKWTDEYVASHMKPPAGLFPHLSGIGDLGYTTVKDMPLTIGSGQESPNNFFAFFEIKRWDLERNGLFPYRFNDWDFATHAKHARYADSVRLAPEQPHFYFQAGVSHLERKKSYDSWTFVSRDLPSFSSPNETFFVFHPENQKGIQCRFGERGVVAATHYDGGRNFVGMVTGAKRYVLSPPRECPKLGVFKSNKSPIYRHSLLNFGHITQINHPDMSIEERRWLELAGDAQSVETVLKQGEVLYIPSHWFHYIVSLQKSAQCNVRSGVDKDGHPFFGNQASVKRCEA